jgi:hypothetical protein
MLLPSNDGCDGDKKFSLLNKWNFNETNASIDAKDCASLLGGK